MPDYIEVILRSLLAFGLLLIGARILGKEKISQLTLFGFVTMIPLGAIAANLASNLSMKLYQTIISIALFIGLSYLVAQLSLKSQKMRKLFFGDPTIVIQNGKILEENMKKMRYTLDYLTQQLREKDAFHIEEVLYAIVETNGTLTVLKKPQYRNVTRQDLALMVRNEQRLPIELIMDGQIIHENLKQNNLTEAWLQTELQKKHVESHEVVYAVLSVNGNLYIDLYRDHIHSPMDQE